MNKIMMILLREVSRLPLVAYFNRKGMEIMSFCLFVLFFADISEDFKAEYTGSSMHKGK